MPAITVVTGALLWLAHSAVGRVFLCSAAVTFKFAFMTLPYLNTSINHFLTSEKSSKGFVFPSAARWRRQKCTSQSHTQPWNPRSLSESPGSRPKLPLMYDIGCQNGSKPQIIVAARKWQFGTQPESVSSCHGNFGSPRSLRSLAKLCAPKWFWDEDDNEAGTHTYS